jgi:adenosylcobinamide-GDP ribazoletransferase
VSYLIRELRNIISFLTIIPAGMTSDCLEDVAKYMYLFPLVGAFIGFLSGIFAYILLKVIGPFITGALTLGFILFITGFHHTDGLLDFGDGLMCHGSPEERIRVMHDPHIGTGGFTLGLIIYLTTLFSLIELKLNIIIQSLIISETSAKLAMVFIAWAGRSAHKGMGAIVVDVMHGKYRFARLSASLLISFIIILPLTGLAGLIIVAMVLATSYIIVLISNRNFGGITGDVIGAGNEISRLASLLAILVIK